MGSQSSSQEMDYSEPCSQDVEEQSLTNTVEMTSAQSSLESNMDCSESPENGNEDGSDDQDDSSHSDSSSEGPPTDGSQEVSSGSQEQSLTNTVEMTSAQSSLESKDASCQTKSPITEEVQITSTNGSLEVTADNNNGSLVFVLKRELKICMTMSQEDSTEKQSNLKRKSDGQEEEVSKEKKNK